MSFLSTVSQYFDQFLHQEPPAPSLTPEQELQRAASDLGASLGALSEMGRTLQACYPDTPRAQGPDRENLERRAMAAQQERMRTSILEAHRRLGTGLDAERLRLLDEGMEQIEPHLTDCVGQDIAKRVTSCSLHRIFREVGALAWDRLLELMERQGLPWPAPSGMSPSAGVEEIRAASERNRSSDRESFLERSPAQVRELMLGVVRIWRAAYPTEDSALWQETVWQGVAAGLRIALFEKAADAMQRNQEMVVSIRQLLEQELAATRELLARGLQSSEELNQVLTSTDRLCRQQVPELVWNLIQPAVTA